MTQAIKSYILTLVLPNHASGDISHDNLYKTALNDPSECIRPMNIKSFNHFFVHIDFLLKKIMLSVHLISLSRSSDRSNKKFMILMIVANIRLISVD